MLRFEPRRQHARASPPEGDDTDDIGNVALMDVARALQAARRDKAEAKNESVATLRGSIQPTDHADPTTSSPCPPSIGIAARADERRLMLKYNPARFVQAKLCDQLHARTLVLVLDVHANF